MTLALQSLCALLPLLSLMLQAMQTANSRLRQMLTAMLSVKQNSKHCCHKTRLVKSPRAEILSPRPNSKCPHCQKTGTVSHDRCSGRHPEHNASRSKRRDESCGHYVKPRNDRWASRAAALTVHDIDITQHWHCSKLKLQFACMPSDKCLLPDTCARLLQKRGTKALKQERIIISLKNNVYKKPQATITGI